MTTTFKPWQRVPTLFEVTRIGEYTEVLYFLSYNQAQLSLNVKKIVLEWSCKILSGFRKALIENMIVMGLQSG